MSRTTPDLNYDRVGDTLHEYTADAIACILPFQQGWAGEGVFKKIYIKKTFKPQKRYHRPIRDDNGARFRGNTILIKLVVVLLSLSLSLAPS
jgi:hypothetical protein